MFFENASRSCPVPELRLAAVPFPALPVKHSQTYIHLHGARIYSRSLETVSVFGFSEVLRGVLEGMFETGG
eukprot:767305-Hanusia_phi.AAC.4